MNEPMPRGAIAIPAWSGGYPISVWSMTGSSTRLPYNTKPSTAVIDRPSEKVGIRNTRRSTTGCSVVSSRQTNPASAAIAVTSIPVMNGDDSQSSC
jgi:hypothetical protein